MDLGLTVPFPKGCDTDAPKTRDASALLRQPFIRQKYFGRSVSLAVERWKPRRILDFRHAEGKGLSEISYASSGIRLLH
jgi:hypothetical protein